MYDVKNDNPSHKHACRREDQVKVKVYYRYQLMFLNIILVMKSLSVIEAFLRVARDELLSIMNSHIENG